MAAEWLRVVWLEARNLYAFSNVERKDGVSFIALKACGGSIEADICPNEILAGEYPSSLAEAVPQLHFSGEFSPYGKLKKMIPEGDPTGLYHLMVGDGQNALVANGLGGTSLLNANVFLRADPGTLGMEKYWPSEICKPGSLEKYYQRAEQMLQPTPYPEEYPELPK